MAKPINDELEAAAQEASANAQTAADDADGFAFTNRETGDAAPPAAPAGRSKGEEKAEKAEQKRQAEIVAAVEKAHTDELPKLGGPNLNPGA